MKKTRRNAPCPCGSGRKYKKCCLYASRLAAEDTFTYTDLDKLSNKVPGLIQQKKYAEAKDVCQKILDQYPDQIDGLHRSAEVYEAMADYEKAITFYNRTANFAKQADGFDQESVEYFINKAEQLAGCER